MNGLLWSVASAASLCLAWPAEATVRLVLFLPTGPEAAEERRDVEEGVSLACGGRPDVSFAVVASDGRWGAGARDLAAVIHEEHARGVIGGLDARSTHVAAQIVTRLKGDVRLVTPWATAADLAHLGIPWLDRTVPDDDVQMGLVAEALATNRWQRPLALVARNDADAAAAARALRRRHRAPVDVIAYGDDPGPVLARLEHLRPDVLLLFGPPRLAGRLLQSIRRAGVTLPVLGNLRLSATAFATAAGDSAEGVLLPLPRQDAETRRSFRSRYHLRYRRPPSPLALYAYRAAESLLREPGLASTAPRSSSEGADALELLALRVPGGSAHWPHADQRDQQ